MSVMVLFGMVSCSDENIEGNGSVKGGELIQFSIDPAATRTVYEAETGDPAWQIDWLTGDKIRIFCDRAEGKTDAEYTITPTDATHSTPQAASKYGIVNANADGLRWNGALIANNYPKHDFYAVYPSTAVRSTSEGYSRTGSNVDLKLVNNQVCTVKAGEGEEITYIAEPDMNNAYMVAAATGVDPRNVKSQKEPGKAGGINLQFSPIMTTLDLFVAYEGSTNGTEDVDEPLNVTGITVTLPGVPRVAGNCFRYNITGGSKGTLVTDGIPTSTETFFAGVRYNGGNSLPLLKGQSVKFTVFLPPVEISNANQITVRLNASGSNDFTVKVGKAEGNAEYIVGGAKKQIRLPKIKVDLTKVKANNWISKLDDNIYINQLSIPGTNNSAAFKSYAGLATSQSKNLEDQWNAGVRAFEFRTAVSTGATTSYDAGRRVATCYDAGTNLQCSFDEAMTSITGFLTENPGEFAIVVSSYQGQNGGSGISISDFAKMGKNYWLAESTFFGLFGIGEWYYGMPFFVKKWADEKNPKNESWFVDFKPELTIGEARGKIILINFDNYDSLKGVLVNDTDSQQDNGTDSDFSTSGSWKSITYNGTTEEEGIYIQNMFGSRYPSDDAKQTGIRNADDIAVQLHTKDTHKWVINYVGGASSTSLANTANYRATAAANNKFFNEWLINPDRPEGPTGIVMVSHQGVDKANDTNVNVFGANLPQTIIDNNFRFRMQRKEH